jgi:hypothetical protein
VRRHAVDYDVPTAAASAQEADEAVRTINHLTIRDNGGITWPSDLETVVRSLAAMVNKLPQALNQLADIGDALAERYRLYDARGVDPWETADAAAGELEAATTAARQLAVPLTRAAEYLSHLGVRDD